MGERSILVVGGAGALGTALIEAGNEAGFETISVDLRPAPNANTSIIISSSEDLDLVLRKLNDHTLVGVFCVAGSWQGGSINSPDVLKTSRSMWQVNVEPSLMAAQIAATFKEVRVCVLTGAKAVLHGTPEMLGYGMAKKAVVQLAESLGADQSFEPGVACILPYIYIRSVA